MRVQPSTQANIHKYISFVFSQWTRKWKEKVNRIGSMKKKRVYFRAGEGRTANEKDIQNVKSDSTRSSLEMFYSFQRGLFRKPLNHNVYTNGRQLCVRRAEQWLAGCSFTLCVYAHAGAGWPSTKAGMKPGFPFTQTESLRARLAECNEFTTAGVRTHDKKYTQRHPHHHTPPPPFIKKRKTAYAGFFLSLITYAGG